MTTTAIRPLPAKRKNIAWTPVLRADAASSGAAWLPAVLVLGSFGAVAYADHLVVSISLVYLYILPLALAAIFLRKQFSYGLIAPCVLFHDYHSPWPLNLGIRVFHNVSAALCFAFVIYIIQRYVEQREALSVTVAKQRDELLHDVELAAQVQRLFLPVGKPSIAGLEIAGMMRPAKGVSGDYYDFIPVNAHTIQLVVADVAGKGVPAALLMSATAATMQLEANLDQNLLQMVNRLNTGIHSVSADGERYVTLLVAELNAQERKLRYVNCGHNPGLLYRAQTGMVSRLNSSCAPVGISPENACEQTSLDLTAGDVLVFYTDGVTEAENRLAEEFGTERLSALIQRGFSRSAEALLTDIFDNVADFCSGVGFHDDVTVLVVKCNFDGLSLAAS